MQGFKFIFNRNQILALMFLLIVTASCKKETEYIYEVNPVSARKDQINKGIPKSTVEFISIAYSDLFGETIPQNSLGKLTLLYLAFGDKHLIEDMLIKNMLNSPSVSLPSNQNMRNDIPLFVNNAYLKLYNREPNELEAYTLGQSISDDTDLTPELIYYSMMTSDEYRYY
ncbi:MAG: hypothetical protein R2850_13500 [Bacteroidia bacterium]